MARSFQWHGGNRYVAVAGRLYRRTSRQRDSRHLRPERRILRNRPAFVRPVAARKWLREKRTCARSRMTRYIHHVTLQTGHVARQYRRDVSDEAIEAVSALLDSVLTGGQPAVPGFPDFWVSGSHEGRVLVVTLWTGMRDEGIPILTSV